MKKKWVINLDEIPADSTVEKFIVTNTDILKYIQHFSTKRDTDYLSLPLEFDTTGLNQAIIEAQKNVGSFSFKYYGRETDFESYKSTALTWNPRAVDNLSDNPHQAALGSTKYNNGNSQFYEHHGADKNTYADTYSFNQRTPAANSGLIKEFLDTFKRSLIRSRISVIKAQHPETQDLKYLWHQDESVFINMRVNIPTQSNEHYVIQLLENSSGEATISEFSLTPGNAYIYNTQKLHRPYCKELNETDRINLICGVSPWFDYNQETNQWISNDFYGEMHPFDMFLQGHISSAFGKLK